MSATKLLKAGFRELVSVIPPGAELSPNSKIPPEGLGKTPGRSGKKGWYGYNFLTAAPPNAKVAQQWDEWGANVGLRADHYPALDIDVDSPSLAKLVHRRSQQQLGNAPVRRSKGHRMLLPYRTAEPFPRMGLLITYKGSSHLVEFLGAKRQYLVHGTHPSGAKYEWAGHPLWKWEPKLLTEITGEQAEAFLDDLAEHLKGKGLEVERVGKKSLSSEPPPPQDQLAAPSIEKLREVVELLPNPAGSGREHYIEVGYAIKAAGQEDEEAAFEAWQEWADRWEGDGSEDPEADRRNWDRLHPPFKVGWPWLQEQAQEAGEYISAQDEFEADPAAAPPPVASPDAQTDGGDPGVDTPLFITHAQALQWPELLEPPEALIPRIAWRGRLTILAGGDKAGKSTLLAHAAGALTRGGAFLDGECPQGRAVLVGLEEALGDQVRRAEELGMDPERFMYLTRPEPKLLDALRKLLEMWPADLLVIDSLAEYARVVTSGDAPQSGDASAWGLVMRPLVALAREHDIAIVVLHHVKKSDGQYRDSGEIAAAADVLLEMALPRSIEDQAIRRLKGRGRWAVEPFVVALRGGVYELEEGRVRELTLTERILHAVEHHPGTSKRALGEATGGSMREVLPAIDAMIREGILEDRGTASRSELHKVPTASEQFSVGLDDVADADANEDE